MACSFCLSLFLTPFNCFSVGPPPAEIPSGTVPVQHVFLHGLQSLQRSTSSCVFFCVSSHISCLSLHAYSIISPSISICALFCVSCITFVPPSVSSFVPSHMPPPVSTLVPPDMFSFAPPPLLWYLLSLVATDLS